MRFTIKREEFLKGLNVANRAVSSKIAMPVLENLRLDLTKTNTTTAVRNQIGTTTKSVMMTTNEPTKSLKRLAKAAMAV